MSEVPAPQEFVVSRIVMPPPTRQNSYPTTDGRPMAETDSHRKLMMALIEALDDYFAGDPDVYVSGNLLLFYVEGNKRKHVSPDVFVVFGVPKRDRDNYLRWEEGRGPGVVIELTSSSTRKEDRQTKFALYRDVLRVPEYFLFDPFGDWLKPRFQGYRLVAGEYRPMRLKEGRMQSRQLNLWLEPDGKQLRLVDRETGQRLPTRAEARQAAEETQRAQEEARRVEERARQMAEELVRAEAQARTWAETEIQRLRDELAAARNRPSSRNGH